LTPSQYAEYAGDESIVPYDFFLSTALAGIGKKLLGMAKYLLQQLAVGQVFFFDFIYSKNMC